MRRLLRPLFFLAALAFLFEAWLWRRLEPVVERLVALLPWAAFKARLAAAIGRLPPYATFVVFAVPGAILFPFKLGALALLARGHFVLGGFVFFLAKVVGLGITAFLFETCRPKLMEIPWFARLYAWVLRAKAWADAQIAPFKRRIRAYMRWVLPRGRSHALRVLARLRRRAALGKGAGE
jgi:hypothetical protein